MDQSQETIDAVNSLTEVVNSIGAVWSQAAANDQQRADQMYYYKDSQMWNSPANQMYLRGIAGLNPYSQYSAGNSSPVNAVNTGQGLQEALGQMSLAARLIGEKRFNRIAQQIALKQLHLTELKTDADIAQTNQYIKNLEQTNFSLLLSNLFNQNVMPYNIQTAENNANIGKADVIIKNLTAKYSEEQIQAAIDLLVQQAANQKAQAVAKPKEVFIAQQNANANTKNAETNEGSLNLNRSKWSMEEELLWQQIRAAKWDNAQLTAMENLVENSGMSDDDKYALKLLLDFLRNLAK